MLTQAPFIQARNYSKSSRLSVLGVCIHTMEAPEGPKTARNVANWFATQPAQGTIVNGSVWGGSSAHWNVDSNGLIQSVREQDIAWHAGPVNGWSIGVEHAGYAKQTEAEWLDFYSSAMLNHSALLVAQICNRWSIPVQRLTAQDLRDGKRNGIFGHVDVTKGLGWGTHTDPGPYFPWAKYLDMVDEKLETLVDIIDKPAILIGTINANKVNIRAAPSVQAQILDFASKGSLIEIQSHDKQSTPGAPSGWFKVKMPNSAYGYISAVYVTV